MKNGTRFLVTVMVTSLVFYFNKEFSDFPFENFLLYTEAIVPAIFVSGIVCLISKNNSASPSKEIAWSSLVASLLVINMNYQTEDVHNRLWLNGSIVGVALVAIIVLSKKQSGG